MIKLNKNLLETNINKIAQEDIEQNNVFGSAYIVRQNGETVFKRYFGIKDPKTKATVNSDTMFRLASMTKPVTAMAILILVQRGLLSLNDAVKKYIPEFEDIHIKSSSGEDLGKAQTDVTVFHLLTHTSGFGSDSGKPDTMTSDDKKSAESMLKYYSNLGLDFEPFTAQSYSGIAAFDVAALIIEKITGKDFEDFLRQEIFLPCNMRSTTFVPDNKQWQQIIAMHNKMDGLSVIGETSKNCVFEGIPCNHKLGGAGLVSTLEDYSNFAEMLLNRGQVNGKEIVTPEIFDLMRKPSVTESIMPGNERWGLGVRVITSEKYVNLPVGTFGWSGAYGSHFWIDPQNKITAVFMKNSRFDGGAGNYSACRFEKAVHDALEL